MSYRKKSLWNDKNEIRCLLIFKKLMIEGFPRGNQKIYCISMSQLSGISVGSISAKICNYKSLAGVNNLSNFSKNSTKIFKKYKDSSISQIETIIKSING